MRRAPPAKALFETLWAVVLISVMALVDAPWPMTLFLGVAALFHVAGRLRASTTLLRVDSQGISLSTSKRSGHPVRVPWASARTVVVVDDPGGAPRVGIRLHVGAPLPAGVRGLVHDLADLDRVQPALVGEVPRLDIVALAASVQAHGVAVVAEERM